MADIGEIASTSGNILMRFLKDVADGVSLLFENTTNFYNLRVGGVKYKQDLAAAFGIYAVGFLEKGFNGIITKDPIDIVVANALGFTAIYLTGDYLAESKDSLDYKSLRVI